MFAKIVDMLLHWLRVDTHEISMGIFFSILDLSVPEKAVNVFQAVDLRSSMYNTSTDVF